MRNNRVEIEGRKVILKREGYPNQLLRLKNYRKDMMRVMFPGRKNRLYRQQGLR